jgi:hypothetical protein
MTLQARIARIERDLGISSGPRTQCPVCEGTGLDDSEARVETSIPLRFYEAEVELASEYGFDPPPPPETPSESELPPPVRCTLCAGLGFTSVTKARARQEEWEASEAWLLDKLSEVAERLRDPTE